jgi:hypothetical protein
MKAVQAAAVTAAGALAIVGGVVGAGALTDETPTSTTATVVEAIPSCTQVVASGGTVADPCNVEVLSWEQGQRNALTTMAFYGKWKAANPGEVARLSAWAASPLDAPEPVVATAMGGVVRYGLVICRKWTLDMARCVMP